MFAPDGDLRCTLLTRNRLLDQTLLIVAMTSITAPAAMSAEAKATLLAFLDALALAEPIQGCGSWRSSL